MIDPHREYETRRKARLEVVSARERTHRQIGYVKLATIAIGLLLAWMSAGKLFFSAYWLSVPIVVYIALAMLHEFVLRARTRAERAVKFYDRGIARMEDRWAGAGEPGERFREESHVYAEDLDLFGRGSLFELLNSARTPMGENWLAAWLKAPSPVAAVLERQQTVTELREKLDLREDLALAGEELRARLNPEGLTKWAETKRIMPTGLGLRLAASGLAIAAVATAIWGTIQINYWPFLVVLGIEWLFRRRLKSRAEEVITRLDSNSEGLELFAAALRRIERESFVSARLSKMVASLKRGRVPASRAMRSLARLGYWIDAHDSFLVAIVELPLLYSIHVALAAEKWRAEWGTQVRRWADAVGEMEALLSLAGYATEHQRDPFPSFADASECGALFEGEDLGHPLIPDARCVRNSVRLGRAAPVLMVSGSNMSGKSTLLRVTGVNAVLAMAGAPIRGRSLRLTPLTVGTRLHSPDSLQENRSGFYSEILRIRRVFDRTEGDSPVLFLFDELMEGTNSHDRRIGAEGLLRALVERGATGIVTTHDLALTEIGAALGSVVRNAHFEDSIEDGQMRFDYKLRPGVVARSNALELMRLIGLKV